MTMLDMHHLNVILEFQPMLVDIESTLIGALSEPYYLLIYILL